MPGGMTPEQAAWHALLLSAARLQRAVPGAVLVGGTAVALLANHRYSTDADHVVADLKERYDQVRGHLENLEGWSTARASRPPVLILGSLDGQAAGVRQLRRPVPLETQVIDYTGHSLRIPTRHELLRIKAFLVLERNYDRDYVDFLALAGPLPDGIFEAALSPLEQLYGRLGNGASDAGLLFDLGTALKQAEPKDPLKGRSHRFDAMSPNDRPWDLERIRQEGRVQGERVLTLWRALSDNDEPRDADTPGDRPGRGRF